MRCPCCKHAARKARGMPGRSRRRNRSSDGSLPAKPNKILAFQSSNRSLVEEKNLVVFCGARAWPNGCSDLVTDVREAGHGSCDRNFPAKPHQILAFQSSNPSLGEEKFLRNFAVPWPGHGPRSDLVTDLVRTWSRTVRTAQFEVNSCLGKIATRRELTRISRDWDLGLGRGRGRDARVCADWPSCSVWFFMPSAAEPALFDASICLHALASRGVGRYAMLDLADAGACEWRCGCLCLLAPCFCTER